MQAERGTVGSYFKRDESRVEKRRRERENGTRQRLKEE